MATWQLVLLVWTIGVPAAVVTLAFACPRIACWRSARREDAAREALGSAVSTLGGHRRAPVAPRAMAGYRK